MWFGGLTLILVIFLPFLCFEMSPDSKCLLKKSITKRKKSSILSSSSKKKCVINNRTSEVIGSEKLDPHEPASILEIQSQESKIKLSDSFVISTQQKLDLKYWGLPEPILKQYEARGIVSMFPWQVECLSRGRVLAGGNLVYSAPTSAEYAEDTGNYGKTLVAEILTVKTVLEKRKKVIIILPFVSVVREKMFYFQGLLSSSGVRVEGLMGGRSLPGGFKNVDIAICTIEKANSLVNRLLEDGALGDVGCVVVDELHLLGDPFRGYLLELLLTKVKYMCATDVAVRVQVVGMSATLPNLPLLAGWLDAEVYQTEFRPVPLQEFLKVGSVVYDSSLRRLHDVCPALSISNDQDHVIWLCLETVLNGHSVLVFCPTKAWCEKLAQHIAKEFCSIGNSGHRVGAELRAQLSYQAVVEVLEQLKGCPAGLDQVLRRTVAFAVAFHHAGMTLEERDIVEGAFRSGTLRVLVATSTLSSGVNLPARRVIVRSPTFAGRVLEAQTYRQMIGRAGRMGRDTAGESYLLSQRGEQRLAEQLVRAELAPVQSCLGEGHLSASLKRAVLEVVASGAACTPAQLQLYAGSTLLAATQPDVASPIAACVRFLVEEELVREGEGGKYVATPLGQACLAASLPPDQGLELFAELGRARQCFVLDNDLHVIYQVTPYSVSSQWGNLDWLHMLSLWEELSPGMRRVGELVGVEERFIVRAMRGTIKVEASKQNQKLSIHRRFYTALALQDLVNEVPLADVASKFRCSRGMLQSLQQSAATFAGMVTAFCRRLGWASFELLVSQFQDRLQFGVRRELCDLMRLDALNGPRARALFDTGITTLSALAVADVTSVEDALHKAMPFQTSKELDGETSFDTAQRNKMKHVWVTGRRGLTEREAAELLVAEARDLLRKELGVADVKWDVTNGQSSFSDYGSEDSNHGKSQHKQIDVSDIVDTYLVLKTHSRTQDHDMEVEKNDHAVASQKISACSDATSVQFQNEVCEGDKVEGLGITSRAPSPVNFLWPGQSKSKFHLQSQHDDRKTCGETVNDLEEPCSKSNTHAAVHPDPEMSPAPVICSMKVDSDKSARGESPYRKSVAEQVAVSTPRGVVRDEIMDYFSSPFELASSSVTGEHRDVPGGAGRQSPSFGGGACISPIAADRSNSTKDSSDLFSSPSAGTCSNLFVDSLLIDTQLKGVLDACQSKPAEVSQASPEAEYSSPVINKLKMTTKKATDRTKQKKSKHSSEMINTPLTSRSELDRKGLQKKSSVTKKGRRKVSVSTLRWSVDENSSLDQYKYAEDFELKTVANISSPWLRSEGKTVHIFEPEDLEELQSSFRVLSDNSVLNGTKDSVLAEDRITGKPSSSTSSELKVGSLNCEKSETCNDSEPHGKENLDVDVLSIKPEALEVDDIITDSFLEKAFTTYWSAGSGQEGSPNNNEECVSLSPEPLQKSNRNSLCKKLFSSTGKVTRQDEMGKKRPLSLGMKKFKIHPSAKQCNSAVKSSSRNLELLSRTSPENKQCDSSKHPAVTYGNTNATSVFSDEFAGSLKTPKKKSPGALKQKCNLEDDKLLENYSSDDNIVLSSQNDSDSTVNSPWKSKSLYIYSPSIKKQQTSTKHPQTAVDKTVSGKSRTSSTVDQKMKKESWTSVNIIDVCGDAQLLDTFRTELRGQRCVSLSVGCERVPEEPGIGARIMGRRPQAVPGPMLQSGERAVSGVAVCFGERDAYYISLSARQGRVSLEERLAVVRSMAQGAEWLASLRVFDCKEQAKVLGRCCGLALHCPCAEDPKVADWLLQPDGREKNLQALCLTYAADLVWVADKAGPVRGVGSPALSIGSSVPARLRCCMEAVVTWHVAQAQRRVLEERGLLALYSEVEMPTQLCLARSELAGLGFSRPEAERLRALLEGHMGGLERRAYQLAGHPFSLSSPADVAKVLYRELRLGGGKVPGGKQRPSTNKEALMRLKGDHPLPGIILQWRKLSSTVTKMVFPLLNTCVGERMYGCSVTHTATGRISMHEPNLQNIPRDFDISSPDGKHIPVSMRLAFVAGEGRSFVSADYSQLELRLLAHFSADPLLCSILNSGHDVFTSIASSWNKIPEAEVLTELRQRAKQICYGMIYGMGTKALAEQMEVDELVAANFVDSFNRAYPGVKQFLQQAVSQCRSAGYVETLRGRRRYLPAISSPNALLRSHAERQAVNSTIQGSAADVAKLAMVRVDGRLREAFPAILGQGEDHEQPPARLVLHLHDELLYEVSDAKLREVASIIKTNMEAAVSLSVQLPVKMRAGRSWGSLTDLDV